MSYNVCELSIRAVWVGAGLPVQVAVLLMLVMGQGERVLARENFVFP